MGHLLQYGPAAAFYVFALAAQVSGFTSSSVAVGLAIIATLLLFVPACHHSHVWHNARKNDRRAGLDSWYFIAPCLALAVLAIAGASYGFGLRSSAPPSDSVASAPLTLPDPQIAILQSQLDANQKTVAPLKSENETLKKQLAEAQQSRPAPPPPTLDPHTDLIGGPYQPEQLRKMILALDDMQEALQDKVRPARNSLETLQSWPILVRDLGWNEVAKRVETIATNIRVAHEAVIADRTIFSNELKPTLDDTPLNTYNALMADLSDFSQLLFLLEKVVVSQEKNSLPDGVVTPYVARASTKIGNSAFHYSDWINRANYRMQTKKDKMKELQKGMKP